MQRKTHLRQTQSQLLLQRSNFGLDDSDLIIDDEVTFGRNLKAREFGKVVHEDDDAPLSDYVMNRLAQARELAMTAYRKAHA